MKGHFLFRNQLGDTIVEVIIAIAVISSLLIGAYTLTVTSTKAIRSSEEHAQALQLLQGQVELLRSGALAGGLASKVNITQPFCFKMDGTPIQLPSASYCAGTSASDFVHYALQIKCASGTPCPNASPYTTTFIMSASWAALGGGTNNVGLSYTVTVQ